MAKEKLTAETSFSDFMKRQREEIESNPVLVLGARMDMIRNMIPDGELVLKYICEIEKKWDADELLEVARKVMGKKSKKKSV